MRVTNTHQTRVCASFLSRVFLAGNDTTRILSDMNMPILLPFVPGSQYFVPLVLTTFSILLPLINGTENGALFKKS